MCLVKVNSIHLNICLHHTMQGVIRSEDDAVLTHVPCSISEDMNVHGFCVAVVMSFTTMNVHNVSVGSINNLQELRAQLFCQQNAGSNNNSGSAIVDSIMTTLSINNHGQSFPAACRHQDFTFVVCKHTIKDAILMWAKSDGQCCSVDVYTIKHRDTTGSASVPLV